MENINKISPSGLGILKRDLIASKIEKEELEKLCKIQPLNQIDDSKISKEFSTINQYYFHNMWSDEFFKNDPSHLNRWSDIRPYQYNCVSLRDSTDKSLEQTYINADYIYHIWDKSRTDDADFIATQGPIPETYNHFWRMVWQENCHNIVMLCGLTEDGRLMCDIYWPDKVNDTKMYDYLKVTCADEKIINDFLWTRTFNITNTRDNTSREVTQWHAVGWPDRKVPKPEYTEYFEDLMKNTLDLKEAKPNHPIVVHCSAGVGRTGTFMSLYYLTSLMRYYKANNMVSNPNIGVSVFGTVRALREQRMLSVQSLEQYQYIYWFVKKFAAKILK